MSETNTLKKIMLAHNKIGRVWRNNSGNAFYPNGQRVKYGVGVGGSDLIGMTIINGVAVFTAIEVKDENWKFNPKSERECQQQNFISIVEKSGGIAGFVRSVEEYEELIKSFLDKTY